MRVALHALQLQDNALPCISTKQRNSDATAGSKTPRVAFHYSTPSRTVHLRFYASSNTLRSFQNLCLLSTLCMPLLKFAWILLTVCARGVGGCKSDDASGIGELLVVRERLPVVESHTRGVLVEFVVVASYIVVEFVVVAIMTSNLL
jgi:hypothetical protein